MHSVSRTTPDAPPIWIMRQAGRYMSEYQAIRQQYSFQQMIKTPDLATEVTLQPIHAFGMDAAILFSDILVVGEACGCELEFIEGKGPVFTPAIRSEQDIDALDHSNISETLRYVFDAIRNLRGPLNALNTPLIGFAGAPFTVASYMIEGHSNPSLKHTKRLMLESPDLFHKLLDKLCNATITYINGQIEAGIDAFQLFDSWANSLSWDDFNTYCTTYITKIIREINNTNSIPITVFCRGSSVFYPALAQTGTNAISLDWNSSLATVRQALPNIALQGNLDPNILYAPDAELVRRVKTMLSTMKNDPGYIFALGHGILPDMSPDKIRLMVDAVKSS